MIGKGKGGGEGDILIFGNPLVGSPIAAEHINAEPNTKRLGCGSAIPAPT